MYLGELTTRRDKDIIFPSFSFFSGCYQKAQSHQLSLLDDDDDDDEGFSQNPKNPKTPNPETQNPKTPIPETLNPKPKTS